MDAGRRAPQLGDQHTRTGLSARLGQAAEDKTPSSRTSSGLSSRVARNSQVDRGSEASDREKLVTTRGTDELLARAREAGIDLRLDESTLAAVESRLRDV